MKGKKYFLGILIFMLFIPKVYAFTYELDVVVPDVELKVGTELSVKVGLKNIEGTDVGINTCSLNIEFDNNILLNSSIKTLDNWKLTTGKVYLFNSSTSVKEESNLFTIPIKVNDSGSIKLINVECSDGNDTYKIDEEIINFELVNEQWEDLNKEEDNSCSLSNIVLSEGSINFQKNIVNYYLEVSSLENLVVQPILVDDESVYDIQKIDNNKIVIEVVNENICSEKYTIFINQINNMGDNLEKDNNKYVPIFISIICILVIINILRIVINKRKNVTG